MASSLGSGVIVRPEGLVVTSYHVIRDSDEITVVLPDKREFDAVVKLRDEQTDLAVLTINPKGDTLPYLPFGDSDALEVGDLVLAIGNPFGVGQTVTSGIISATARAANSVSDYQFFIQTDAAINPGNSGGALVDMQGRLIGINTAIYSTSGGSNGVGFAIPVNTLAAVMNGEATKDGRIIKPWFGVKTQDLTRNIAESLGMPNIQGVLVKDVHPASPAKEAGIKTGDVIVSVGGKKIDSEIMLNYRISTSRIGEEVAVGILRDGKEDIVRVTLSAPEDKPYDFALLKGKHPLRGMVVATLTPSLAQEIGVDMAERGVVVVETVPGGYFGIGLQPGDIILKINGKDVTEAKAVDRMAQTSRGGMKVTYRRGAQVMTLNIQGLW